MTTFELVEKLLYDYDFVKRDVDISPSMRLNTIALDSLDFLELIMELESELEIELDETAFIQLQTVGDVVIMVDNELGINIPRAG